MRYSTSWAFFAFSGIALASNIFAKPCELKVPKYQSQHRGAVRSLTRLLHVEKESLATVVPDYIGKPKFGVTMYRLNYTSQDLKGEWIEVSGLLSLPDNCARHYPVISMQHGTIINDKEAPSIEKKIGRVEASQGYAVLSQDYIGFGASVGRIHPYGIAQGYATPAVDMLRAFYEIAELNGIQVKDQLFITGYSEGGYAALAVQKAIETEYAGEFKLAATAPGAGFYDIFLTGAGLIYPQKTNPIYVSYILSSYIDNYGQPSDYQKIFKNAEQHDFAAYFSGQGDYDKLLAILPDHPGKLLNSWFRWTFIAKAMLLYKLGEKPSWLPFTVIEQKAYENSLTRAWQPKSPTRFYHCVDDEVVPFEASQLAFDALGKNNPLISLEKIASPAKIKFDHETCPANYTPVLWFDAIIAQQSRL